MDIDREYYLFGAPLVNDIKLLVEAKDHAKKGKTVKVHSHAYGEQCSIECKILKGKDESMS